MAENTTDEQLDKHVRDVIDSYADFLQDTEESDKNQTQDIAQMSVEPPQVEEINEFQTHAEGPNGIKAQDMTKTLHNEAIGMQEGDIDNTQSPNYNEPESISQNTIEIPNAREIHQDKRNFENGFSRYVHERMDSEDSISNQASFHETFNDSKSTERTRKNDRHDGDDGNDIPDKVNKETAKAIGVINFDTKLFDSAVESLDCDMCFVAGRVVSPTTYCITCQIYLCGTCYKYHAKIPATCDHDVVHRNDLLKNVYKSKDTYADARFPTKDDVKEKPLQLNRRLVDPGRYTSEHVKDEDTVCAPCKTENRRETGTAFCVNCGQYMCRKCKSYHTKFGTSSDHEIVHKHSMEEGDFKTFVPAFTPPENTATHKRSDKDISRTFGSTSTLKTDFPSKTSNINWKNPKSFSALVYHDVLTPEITGLAYLGDRKLLVSDRRNKCLKLFSEKLLPLSVLDIPDIADVTSLNDATAVVSQPEKKALLYIGFKGDSKMFIRRSVETEGKYWGVDSLNRELFALCMSDSSSQASIHILNQSGQVLSIIQPHLGQGYDLQLKNSKYFAVSPAGGTFYISDTILGVVAIGTDGRAIFSVRSPDIERPSGIRADSKNIYVCCPATSSIATISPDGTFCYDAASFTEDMVLPNCISLAPNSSQVAVAFLEGETINLYKPKN